MAEAITVEKSQRSPDETPWYWLGGDTYPHRELLKRHGARFSGRRRQWYFIGAELPPAIAALVTEPTPPPPVETPTPIMSPELTAMIEAALAADDAHTPLAPPPPDAAPPPAIRITKPAPLPAEGEARDAVQAALAQIHAVEFAPPCSSMPPTPGRAVPIAQHYCGELTGSITGSVYCYGYAVHEGVCIYLNLGGPRMAVEAIRAKLSKGEIVSLVPDDAPAVELTAGEGNTGMYHDFLRTLPEARFTSLILLHHWALHPDYSGSPAIGKAPVTFILRTSDDQAQAQLRHHVAQLVNLPVFDLWTLFLWQAGQAAMLVRPTRSGGGIDLLTVTLDPSAWTRLITGGLTQGILHLPTR